MENKSHVPNHQADRCSQRFSASRSDGSDVERWEAWLSFQGSTYCLAIFGYEYIYIYIHDIVDMMYLSNTYGVYIYMYIWLDTWFFNETNMYLRNFNGL